MLYDHTAYCVVGIEVRDKNEPGSEPRVYLPAYKLPHRPYPLGVYLYALQLYSSNPSMGQRQAAEETRRLFGLETFSHTTLSRAMSAMARMIDEKDEVTQPAAESEKAAQVSENSKEEPLAAPNNLAHTADKKQEKKHFPSVEDTREIRRRISGFLRERLKPPRKAAFMEACGELALEWYSEKKCLLL